MAISRLSSFLHPVRPVNEEKDVMVSDRFLNDDGTPMMFRVRALSQADNDKLVKQSTRQVKTGNQMTEKLDTSEYARRIIVAGTVFPNFAAKEVCDAAGVADPALAPGALLKAGEVAKLSAAIMELSAFDTSAAGEAHIEEEVKN